jgi:hypothetical protein
MNLPAPSRRCILRSRATAEDGRAKAAMATARGIVMKAMTFLPTCSEWASRIKNLEKEVFLEIT